MTRKTNSYEKLWQELKRRKVFGVVTTYAATAYIIIEVTNNLAVPLHLADWFLTLELIILVIGLPVIVFLSWIFDFTSEGIKKTGSAEESESIGIEGKRVKRIFRPSYILNAILIIAVAALAYPKIFKSDNLEIIRPKERISVAVLPFTNLSNDPGQDYFSDGLVDDILDRLCKIRDLDVRSRTSSMRFKNTKLSLKEIASLLSVSAILEGSVRKFDNNVRITVKLINAKTDSHLWSETYDKDISDLFSIQSAVAKAVASELKAVITPEMRQLIEKKPTTNMEAYDAYLKGLFYHGKLNREALEMAMKYFELAKEKDPEFALAYVGIGRVWRGLQQMSVVKVSDGAPKAEEAAKRALELDSTISEVHHLLGGIRTWTNWDWKGGEASFRKAIELNPQNADAHSAFSHLLMILGRSEDGMKHIGIALNLDPLNSKIKSFYGVDLLFMRRYDEAVNAFREAMELDPSQGLVINIIPALYFSGKEDEAVEMMKKIWTDPDLLEAINGGYKKEGFRGAEKNLADVLAERSKKIYIAPYIIAYQYALAGEADNSMLWLEKAYEERSANLPYLLVPTFDILRDNPRFQNLCERMNLPYK
jgi:adenylate cyclase